MLWGLENGDTTKQRAVVLPSLITHPAVHKHLKPFFTIYIPKCRHLYFLSVWECIAFEEQWNHSNVHVSPESSESAFWCEILIGRNRTLADSFCKSPKNKKKKKKEIHQKVLCNFQFISVEWLEIVHLGLLCTLFDGNVLRKCSSSFKNEERWGEEMNAWDQLKNHPKPKQKARRRL